MTAERHVVAVPVDHALVFDARRGWHVITAPPDWWLAEQEQLLHEDEERRTRRHLTVVPERREEASRTACRPGRGPCGRRHAHANQRRAG